MTHSRFFRDIRFDFISLFSYLNKIVAIFVSGSDRPYWKLLMNKIDMTNERMKLLNCTLGLVAGASLPVSALAAPQPARTTEKQPNIS